MLFIAIEFIVKFIFCNESKIVICVIIVGAGCYRSRGRGDAGGLKVERDIDKSGSMYKLLEKSGCEFSFCIYTCLLYTSDAADEL